MDVNALLDVVEALPTARRVPAAAGLEPIVLIAGIEVARTSTAGEQELRRTWRQRHGGGATPLLLVNDDRGRPDSVQALGPVDGNGPLRSVDTDALRALLVRISSLPRLSAVRELAAELDRLDQAGIPGLKLHEMLTVHTLDVRLRGDVQRWSGLEQAVGGVPAGGDWQRVLTGLGYEVQRRPQRERGRLLRHDGRPVAVVHPTADPSQFARLGDDGRPPEGVLLNDCRRQGCRYGLLASGSRLRLFATASSRGSATGRYVDFDAATLGPDDRAFLGLLGPQWLADGSFEQLEEEAQSFGAALRKRVDDRLRQRVLPILAHALGQWARDDGQDLNDDTVRSELQHAALTLVFRALFILYAEGARYLPIDHPAYRHSSLTALVEEAANAEDRLDPRSTSLWDRFLALVKALRTGDTRRGVPAYNGALFSSRDIEGAATLERLELRDTDFGRVLAGLGRDVETEHGVDYSTLEIGHLGHIYEGLLSLALSLADAPLSYDARGDRYIPAGAAEPDVVPGDLLWQTHEGGRKGGGVYYTRTELVSHLVRQTVVPAFQRHLERVRQTARTDPAAAARELFDFAVLDPACGSAHFLVVVVNELADLVVAFLADSPLPAVRADLERLAAGAAAGVPVEDVALLRRLVLKRCVYGVDLSPMGGEIAKLSLWLAAFVPGLSLAYLDRNVQVGNSLVGVADPASMRLSGQHHYDQGFYREALDEAIKAAAEAAARVAAGDDRTPEEYQASAEADAEAHTATAYLERLFDLWSAEPFGVAGARVYVELHGTAVLNGERDGLVEAAETVGREHRFLHWPTAFPQVFRRDRPGFDAVIGNPPWEEVTRERLAFYALFRPGLRSMDEAPREAAIGRLLRERPELEERLAVEREALAAQRTYLASAEYASMPGDPDLYKLFCQRYQTVLRDDGVLGVVLPRSVFAAKGSEAFRSWLFRDVTCDRLDFALNRRFWMFDTHPQYTVALVAAHRAAPKPEHCVEVAGPADSLEAWEAQTAAPGLALSPQTFGPGWTIPLLPSQADADLLAKLRQGRPFPCGSGGRWRCFPVRELDETNDRRLWHGADEGDPLWKGESFDQYDPSGAGARWIPDNQIVRKKLEKPRPGSGSLLAAEYPVAVRRRAVLEELDRARVAFRDVSRATDARTVRACLIPPRVRLTNTAPYLAFVVGEDPDRAACLAMLNSLPFDWQARRFVETHLNFFLLEGLVVAELGQDAYAAVGQAAARLSCVDDRFAEFARAVGVPVGPLDEAERERLRAEIDALVARAWDLTPDDLEIMYRDFTVDAVPQAYRDRLSARLAELA